MIEYGDLVRLTARPGVNLIGRNSQFVIVAIYLGLDEPWELFHRFFYNGNATEFDEVFWIFEVI